jgi:hypothetical protein
LRIYWFGRTKIVGGRDSKNIAWILHESEVFICKALKGEAIVDYAEPLIMKGAESAIRRIMKASGSPAG